MLTIRLTRVGKKNSPAYRVVVADKKRAVKRKFIEIIGNYNPILKPKTLVINKERAVFWMSRGAQPSDTVRNLMCDLEILPKKEKVNKVYGKKLSKKAIKEGGETKPQATESETAAEEPENESAVADETLENTESAPEAPAETKSEEETAEKTSDKPGQE